MSRLLMKNCVEPLIGLKATKSFLLRKPPQVTSLISVSVRKMD